MSTESTEKQQIEIPIDPETAFQLKLQEFDKNIATAECQVTELKKQKIEFIYNRNVQLITEQYKQSQIKKQVDEEVKTKIAEADLGK